MLKRLFYASASILMLALAYHLGARSAGAQSSVIEAGNIEFLTSSASISYSGAVGRTVYAGVGNPMPSPVPGSARIVATGWGSNGFTVMLENGDLYWWDSSVFAWQYQGNLLGSATPDAQRTWGQLKAQYRK